MKPSSTKAFAFFLLSAFLLALPLSGPSRADDTPPPPPAAEGRHTCIQEADGFVQLSEKATIEESRAQAFAEARRQALEGAGAYISSQTWVKDFETRADLVFAKAEGEVRILESKDFGIENNSRYHVWIKAEVAYDIRPKPSAAPLPPPDAGPLTVRVWTDKKSYRQGESIRIFIQGNRDFYGRIVDLSATGQIFQLLPNRVRQDCLFKGGLVYSIPGPGDVFRLDVTPPYGEDRLVVYASDVPLGELSLDPAGTFYQYDGSEKSLGMSTRGVRVTPSKADPKATGAEFFEASWTFTTTD